MNTFRLVACFLHEIPTGLHLLPDELPIEKFKGELNKVPLKAVSILAKYCNKPVNLIRFVRFGETKDVIFQKKSRKSPLEKYYFQKKMIKLTVNFNRLDTCLAINLLANSNFRYCKPS